MFSGHALPDSDGAEPLPLVIQEYNGERYLNRQKEKNGKITFFSNITEYINNLIQCVWFDSIVFY